MPVYRETLINSAAFAKYLPKMNKLTRHEKKSAVSYLSVNYRLAVVFSQKKRKV